MRIGLTHEMQPAGWLRARFKCDTSITSLLAVFILA